MQDPSAAAAAPRSDPPVPVGASRCQLDGEGDEIQFPDVRGLHTWANGRLYDRNLMFTVLREGN